MYVIIGKTYRDGGNVDTVRWYSEDELGLFEAVQTLGEAYRFSSRTDALRLVGGLPPTLIDYTQNRTKIIHWFIEEV